MGRDPRGGDRTQDSSIRGAAGGRSRLGPQAWSRALSDVCAPCSARPSGPPSPRAAAAGTAAARRRRRRDRPARRGHGLVPRRPGRSGAESRPLRGGRTRSRPPSPGSRPGRRARACSRPPGRHPGALGAWRATSRSSTSRRSSPRATRGRVGRGDRDRRAGGAHGRRGVRTARAVRILVEGACRCPAGAQLDLSRPSPRRICPRPERRGMTAEGAVRVAAVSVAPNSACRSRPPSPAPRRATRCRTACARCSCGAAGRWRWGTSPRSSCGCALPGAPAAAAGGGDRRGRRAAGLARPRPGRPRAAELVGHGARRGDVLRGGPGDDRWLAGPLQGHRDRRRAREAGWRGGALRHARRSGSPDPAGGHRPHGHRRRAWSREARTSRPPSAVRRLRRPGRPGGAQRARSTCASSTTSAAAWPGRYFTQPWLDTLMLARRLLNGRVQRHDLGTLAAWADTTVRPNHRALPDAEATAEVLLALVACSTSAASTPWSGRSPSPGSAARATPTSSRSPRTCRPSRAST